MTRTVHDLRMRIVASGTPAMLMMSGALLSGAAIADQAASTGAAGGDEVGLAEIVVTAQKRVERLSDVPVAVTAIQGDVLVSSGVESETSIASLTPNVTVDVNANFIAPYIRGVGTAYANPGLEPSVATYIDDIYVSRADAGFLSFNDVERIEVLKGPQGTLYGRNTTGGAIRIITKDATSDFKVGAALTGGNYGRIEADAFINGSLGNHLSGRLDLQHDSDNGWINNLTPGYPKLENRDLNMGRVKLKWDPSDELVVRLSADFMVKYDREGPAFLPLYGGTTETGVALGGKTSTDPYTYSGTFPNNSSDYQGFEGRQGGAELRIDYKLDGATLSSISGYRNIWFHGLADLDTTTVNLIQANTVKERTSDLSQEFQAVSDGKGPLNWVGGLYYFHENAGHNFGVGGLGVSGPLGIPNAFTGGDGTITIDSFAPYGQVAYKFTPQWEVLVGARYTYEKKKLDQNIFYITTVDSNFAPVAGPPLVAIPASNTGAQVRPESLTPKVGVNWRPMDGVLTYLSYTKGFKSGGFNLPQPSPSPVEQVGNEYLEATELGVKLEVSRLRANAAIFHYKGTDLQVQITDQHSGITSVTNAGSSKTNGAEADVAFAVVKGFEMDAGVGYLDAIFTSFPGGQKVTPAPVGTVTTVADLTGNALPLAPRWSGYLRPVFTLPLPDSLGNLDASLVVSYSGAFYWTADQQLSERARTLLNGNLGWKSVDGHYGLNAYGTNLTNRYYVTHEAPFATGGWRVPGPPRMYGVRGWVNF